MHERILGPSGWTLIPNLVTSNVANLQFIQNSLLGRQKESSTVLHLVVAALLLLRRLASVLLETTLHSPPFQRHLVAVDEM